MTMVHDRGQKIGKNQFSVEIFVCKYNKFLNNFKPFLDQIRKYEPSGCLISFRIIKDFPGILICIEIGFLNFQKIAGFN